MGGDRQPEIGRAESLTRPGEGRNYYMKPVTWRSFEVIHRHLNAVVSGKDDVTWWGHFKQCHGSFDTGLFFNCGNGWVERGFFRAGIVRRAVGFDISSDLLRAAEEEAAKLGMPASYSQTDVNVFVADGLRCDLVVNNGAGHHVAYLDRLTRQLHRALNPAGLYVMMDYTGPHRNQYPWEIWSKIVEFNETLPPQYRKILRYPHMKTMLKVDPTEAIHSDLQIPILKRYFDILEHIPLGGGIAYTLLHKNQTLHRERNTPQGEETVERILEADRQLLARLPESSLFSYCVAKARPGALRNPKLIEWTRDEEARETRAQRDGGRYYAPRALELIYNELSRTEYQLQIVRKTAGIEKS